MTTLALLLWIAFGMAAQLAVFLAVIFWRHWSAYQRLRLQAAGLDVTNEASGIEMEHGSRSAAAPVFRSFRVTRKVLEDPAQTACSIHLTPEDKQPLPDYLPGQYLTFRFDIPRIDGRSEQIIRCYSLSDAPQRDHYRVTIKRAAPPAGRADIPPGRSSTFLHDQVKEGDILQVKSPSGHFHLDGGMSPVVLIAGGIGITPMLSMLNWSLSRQKDREIWLFYGVRNSREHVMKLHLESLAANYQYAGRVNVELLRLHLPLKPYHFYLCGLPSMMESLVPALDDWGVPESRIHFEAFGPSSVKRHRPETVDVPAPPGAMVTFTVSGRQLPWDSAAGSLLDFAESNGVSIPYGCRAGGCGTCQTTILNGEVTYKLSPDFDPEPGSCLVCVCVPKANVSLEA
jgi:ferredoxin-NADP reductase